MHKLIKQQNENLKLNLKPQAITPIAIPEKFIKHAQDENPMEVITNLINTKKRFLGYRILTVEGCKWYFIMWKSPYKVKRAMTNLNNNFQMNNRLTQDKG